MINVLSMELRNKIWLMYLRKSRQDDPNETVEEVLAKHEGILQDWAKRELGYEIPEDCIYREVVSGESLEDRVEIKKVLSRIEDQSVAGVLVVEPQRLSRGDLMDCGTLINTLRFTKTLVVTPMMTYDMENKMERRFFQDELMRGRDYLEYTKEILARGRIASVKRGCYIGAKPPYGYDKITIGKDHTLTPNENADVVRMIFSLYVNEHLSYGQIARKLDEMGAKPVSRDTWDKQSVKAILRNYHYIGKVYYNRRKDVIAVENGERVTRRVYQSIDNFIMAEGKHQAIIDREMFEEAQNIIDQNPRLWKDRDLKNPLAGVLRCSKCGLAMAHHPYKHAFDRIECRSKPMCFKSARIDDVVEAVAVALEQGELPKLEAHLKNGDGKSAEIQKKLLQKLEKQLSELRDQEETQYEFLETKRYTQELFDRRNAALRAKMEDLEKKIDVARKTIPASVNYEEKIITLKAAIDGLRSKEISAKEKNRLLKAIVERIDFSAEDGEKRGDTKLHLGITLRI